MRYTVAGAQVTVVGLARSGLAAALLLKRLGAIVSAVDRADSQLVRLNKEKLEREDIKVEIAVDEKAFVGKADLIVISPGVKQDSEVVLLAKRKNIPLISELELGSQHCRSPIIAVTGTNGKTTVTTLIAEIIKASGKKVFVCGNIGTPLSSYVLEATEDDFVVAEISSFQLERIDEFSPFVAVLLNFSPDHLDRYKSVEDYFAAKKKIFINQKPTDWAVLNFTDATCINVSKEIKARVVFFNEQPLPGLDPNQQAVMTVSKILNLKDDKSLEVLRNFKGIEHRLELVRTLSGVEFINDSKATNVDSGIWALEHMTKPVILIAGGHDKGADLEQIRPLVRNKVKTMILIGEATNKFSQTFRSDTIVLKSESLLLAVSLAFEKAQSGDCVLLSPLCASFDMFSDYEDRGRQFRQFVNQLKAK
jgi:UDP-N-acetylmuramoylalanine--D-glutamate ligase